MAQRPGFDMSKVSMNDKILLGVTAAFLIDSFLPWQRVCVSVGALGKVCGSASAWGGSASWAGVLAGLASILLLVTQIVPMLGAKVPPALATVPTIAILAGATALFGILKFLLTLGNSAYLFGYIGLILALAIGYYGWLHFRATQSPTMPPSAGPTTTA
jgi:hypothetical protein